MNTCVGVVVVVVVVTVVVNVYLQVLFISGYVSIRYPIHSRDKINTFSNVSLSKMFISSEFSNLIGISLFTCYYNFYIPEL